MSENVLDTPNRTDPAFLVEPLTLVFYVGY